MLRYLGYDLSSHIDEFIFDKFLIDPPSSRDAVSIWNFSELTPDSFIWMIVIDNHTYYLYAEDHIGSLQEVEGAIRAFTKSNKKLEFVRSKQVKAFEDTSPVKSATIYQRPSNYDNIKLYASESGYDFVFLARSYQDPNEAYFREATQ